MKQYKVTYKVDVDAAEDCVLDSSDPLHKIQEEQFLGKLVNFDVEQVETPKGHDESI